jgi:hypothetical protein
MVEGRLAKTYGAGCLRGMVISIVTAVVFICIVGAGFVVTYLAPVPEDMRLFIFLGVFVLAVGLLTVVVAGWAVWQLRQRQKLLDAIFVPLGLKGSAYLTSGRQYHTDRNRPGNIGGRQVDVYFYRGPALDIFIAASLRTRMGVGMTSGLGRAAAGALNRSPLVMDDPSMRGLVFYPSDERWGRELLADEAVRTSIVRLMAPGSSFEVRTLLFQPESVELKLNQVPLGSLTAENVRGWISDLIELAQAAESVSPAEKVEVVSDLERRSRLNRSSFTLPAIGIVLAVIGIPVMCILVVSGLWILLMEMNP